MGWASLRARASLVPSSLCRRHPPCKQKPILEQACSKVCSAACPGDTHSFHAPLRTCQSRARPPQRAKYKPTDSSRLLHDMAPSWAPCFAGALPACLPEACPVQMQTCVPRSDVGPAVHRPASGSLRHHHQARQLPQCSSRLPSQPTCGVQTLVRFLPAATRRQMHAVYYQSDSMSGITRKTALAEPCRL